MLAILNTDTKLGREKKDEATGGLLKVQWRSLMKRALVMMTTGCKDSLENEYKMRRKERFGVLVDDAEGAAEGERTAAIK